MKARLGVNEDKRKTALMRDERLMFGSRSFPQLT